ncbi:NAD(P)H-binding protein [Terracoccus luteus]|uniref:Uncharacterized protein YbjT (DUF2867 family) n=1 Tax=Terracoccus luteus TaxID=53356 RepID=A0A839Q2X8_9MICO|nr:NAD(P)H-binding protein [Terracoccus luteus]MBB2987472.1 uncharacterized protein YbjT (DUF2867 family) [Terracoccus luteus]MCP2173123.1 uncharacterized protein YbjT (DUF2867 family) [Terracoccus luteus]
MKVLVTGATGYIGSRTVPELLGRGHDVVATHTSETPRPTPWSDRVEWRRLDVLQPRQALEVVSGVDAVVYLVHGLSETDFRQTDREAAENVRAAMSQNGVGRVVYLSGIVPDVPEGELSEHIASRLEVERILADGDAAALSLRAAVVVGSGSTSFEIIRQLSQRLPLVQGIPEWMRATVVQPVAVSDAVHHLGEAVERGDVVGHVDVAGPDRVTYPELLQVFSDVAGLRRVQVPLPALPESLAGWLAGQLTDVPTQTVESLMASLRHDMVAGDDRASRLGLAPERPTPLRAAVERALSPFDEDHDGAAVGADPAAPSIVDPEWSRRG